MKHWMSVTLAAAGLASAAWGKVDLTTLPTRDTVQMTIYNSADMTLVRESRALTLKQGLNRLEFSWANTLIDPTSLEMLAREQVKGIEIFDLTYPPRVQNLGVWNIRSGVSGKVPVEITYLTSGLSWRAFYLGTLTADEKKMRLQGYVRVANQSGEDYENAQTRLIVGQVHILDEIAELARRKYPYGSPVPLPPESPPPAPSGAAKPAATAMRSMLRLGDLYADAKEIRKEGLSEYFLYTIAGTETIPHGWAKRLPSFEVAEVPVLNLYKFEEDRYGAAVVRFLSFKNDKAHQLGDTPIPGGTIKVYRGVDPAQHLAYEGQSTFKYIPVEQDVELSLGPVANVVVEPKLMDFKTDQYLFDGHGDVSGWDEIREWKFTVKNTRAVAVRAELTRNLGTKFWEIANEGDCGKYEKVDLDTVKYTLELPPQSQREFTQILRTRHGRRAE